MLTLQSKAGIERYFEDFMRFDHILEETFCIRFIEGHQKLLFETSYNDFLTILKWSSFKNGAKSELKGATLGPCWHILASWVLKKYYTSV